MGQNSKECDSGKQKTCIQVEGNGKNIEIVESSKNQAWVNPNDF